MSSKRLVKYAKDELKYWKGQKETSTSVAEKLVDYWRLGAGWGWVTNNNIQEYDNEYPWSAAGLSYIVRKVYPWFPQSAAHSKYTLWAKQRREAGENKAIAYKPDEYTAKAGDIILKTRGSFNGDLNSLYEGATSHGDIVVENNGSSVKAIGWNLGNTVKEVSYPATNGTINDPKHFAIIKMS